MQRRCGWCVARIAESCPVAPPTSQTVSYFEKSNCCASASKLPREMPAIAPMNCSSLAGSLYSSSNIGFRLCLTSFWGCPERSASVRSPQNP